MFENQTLSDIKEGDCSHISHFKIDFRLCSITENKQVGNCLIDTGKGTCSYSFCSLEDIVFGLVRPGFKIYSDKLAHPSLAPQDRDRAFRFIPSKVIFRNFACGIECLMVQMRLLGP